MHNGHANGRRVLETVRVFPTRRCYSGNPATVTYRLQLTVSLCKLRAALAICTANNVRRMIQNAVRLRRTGGAVDRPSSQSAKASVH